MERSPPTYPKGSLEGGILKPQLRTMIFIFRQQHVFYEEKKCDHNVTIWKHQHYFHAIVSSVVCFAAGQRAIHQIEPTKVNIQFYKLLLAVDGQPASIDWSLLRLCQSSCGSIRHLCLV